MTTEDRVKARLAADTAAAQKAEAEAVKAHDQATDAFVAALAKLDKAETATHDLTKTITAAKRQAVLDAHKAVGKTVLRKLRAHDAVVAAAAEFARLQSDKEFQRRMKTAAKFGDGGEPLTGRSAAEVILLQAGKPLHYTEITRLALESGVLKLKGKTPEQTMSAYLAKAAKKGDKFVRLDAGVFDLASRHPEKAEAAKAQAEAEAKAKAKADQKAVA